MNKFKAGILTQQWYSAFAIFSNPGKAGELLWNPLIQNRYNYYQVNQSTKRMTWQNIFRLNRLEEGFLYGRGSRFIETVRMDENKTISMQWGSVG